MALTIRGGAMPASDQVERIHHLIVLRDLVTAINMQNDRRSRIQRLRQQYDIAGQFFDILLGALPGTVMPTDKRTWRDNQLVALRAYAAGEQLW
jgi:hypothetical protein